MTARLRRLDPTGREAAIALAIVAALANGVWIFLDRSIPSWDQAHYLSVAIEYKRALQSGGPIDLLRTIHAADPGRGPLFTVLLLPFVYVFGPAARSGLLLNLLIAPVLYFASGEIAWALFRNRLARLLTIALVATMPLLVGLFHNVLQDFLLVTLTAVSLLLLLKSDGFERRGATLAMALAMGLGTLTKVTFPLFVAGPLAVVAAQVLFVRRPATLRRPAVNLAGAALVYLLVAAPWYLANSSPTLEYIRSTTGGPLSMGAGPSDPYTLHAIVSFTLGAIDFNVSWVVVLAGAAALALAFPALRSSLGRPPNAEPLLKLAFLATWVLVPFLSVALGHNQDVRLMAPALPGVAVLVAGAVGAIRRPRARLALAGVVMLTLAYTTLDHVTPVKPGFLPANATLSAGPYVAVVPLGSGPIGYEQLPGPDYATPVIEYVEDVARAEPGGLSVPRSVCLLESEAVANSNTFGYLASAREDPFVFTDVVLGPQGRKGLRQALAGCEFALYVRQPKVSEPLSENRVALVNQPYAASHMTPRLLALFKGPSRSFPIGSRPEAAGEPSYLSNAGRPGRLKVLVRTPGRYASDLASPDAAAFSSSAALR